MAAAARLIFFAVFLKKRYNASVRGRWKQCPDADRPHRKLLENPIMTETILKNTAVLTVGDTLPPLC